MFTCLQRTERPTTHSVTFITNKNLLRLKITQRFFIVIEEGVAQRLVPLYLVRILPLILCWNSLSMFIYTNRYKRESFYLT